MALSLVNQNRIKLREAFKNSGIAVQEVSEMLYIAFVQNKAQSADKSEQVAKSRKWWNEGEISHLELRQFASTQRWAAIPLM